MKRLLHLSSGILVALSCFSCRTVLNSKPGPDKNPPDTKSVSRQRIVCIDPGHPSEVNSGATIQNGTSEVHIAWVIALKLREILEAKGFKVIMTKSREDELVRNIDRAAIGNNSGAAFMVRLHCDAGNDEGFALYAPDRQ